MMHPRLRHFAPSSPQPLWYAQGSELLQRMEELKVSGCPRRSSQPDLMRATPSTSADCRELDRHPRSEPLPFTSLPLLHSNLCPKPCPAAPQDDPDIAPFFQAVQSGGMAALQSYMANPEFLAKLGNKLGDIDMSLPGEGKPAGAAAAATPSANAPGAPPPPEIENLLQAAKCVPHP